MSALQVAHWEQHGEFCRTGLELVDRNLTSLSRYVLEQSGQLSFELHSQLVMEFPKPAGPPPNPPRDPYSALGDPRSIQDGNDW